MSNNRTRRRSSGSSRAPQRRNSGGSSGKSTWWIWGIVAVVIWGYGNTDMDGNNGGPPKTGTTTVCTETFKGGC
jgi:hypothetical protein